MRNQFPIFKTHPNLVYLDSAATTQKPLQVIDRVNRFTHQENANIHRGLYPLSEHATAEYEHVRAQIAKLLGVYSNEIVLTHGTTSSINMLAFGLPKIASKDRNEIVISDMEHHANFVPWRALEKRGFHLKYIRLTQDKSLDLEHAKELISKKTALLSIVHVSNVLGTKNDLKTLGEIAHQSGALFHADMAQSITEEWMNFNTFDLDFASFSGHKMFGPFGTGVLFGRHHLLEQLPPMMTGGDMIEMVSKENITYQNAPQKHEGGTPNISGIIGLGEAISFLQSCDMNEIIDHKKHLRTLIHEETKKRDYLSLISHHESSSVFSFIHRSIHPHDLASALGEKNIAVRAGFHCAMPLHTALTIGPTLRISIQLYTKEYEIQRFFEAIDEITKEYT